MYTVIIVDDDRWALEDIRHSFRFEDWNFQLAGAFQSAEEALQAIQSSPPDLIITDICMALGTGLDLAKACQEGGYPSLVVLISGYERFSYAREALRWGVFDYLLKPLEDGQAQLLMRRVVEKLESRPAVEPVYSDDSFGRMLRYIDDNYTRSLPLEEVSDALFVNRNYLSELFSRRMGMTFTQYKNSLRVRKAQELIAGGHSSMTEVALTCGFDSASTFSRVFKQVTGVSPLGYRAELVRSRRRPELARPRPAEEDPKKGE